MSYTAMMSDFTTILNRDDCSSAQAAVFMSQAVQRIQRDCRLPSMERQQIYTFTGTSNNLVIPSDLIQPIDLIWSSPAPGGRCDEPVALIKTAYRDLMRKRPLLLPKWYARIQTQFWIAGSVNAGEQIQLFYYGNFSPWASGSADNELSASTPDLAVYAALSYAGDYFACDQTTQWEARYQSIKADVIQMGIDLDAEGGPQAIEPVYRWE